MKAFFFLLEVVLLFLLTLAYASLEETCSKINGSRVDYNFCMTSLQVIPESHTADTKGLAIIATNLAKTNFTYNLAKVEELLNSSGLSQGAKTALNDCVEVYNDGIDSLTKAISDIQSGDVTSANSDLSAAGTDADTCDDSLVEEGEEQLLAKENKDASDISDLALSITVLVK